MLPCLFVQVNPGVSAENLLNANDLGPSGLSVAARFRIAVFAVLSIARPISKRSGANS